MERREKEREGVGEGGGWRGREMEGVEGTCLTEVNALTPQNDRRHPVQ